jgi:hypothetical protein
MTMFLVVLMIGGNARHVLLPAPPPTCPPRVRALHYWRLLGAPWALLGGPWVRLSLSLSMYFLYIYLYILSLLIPLWFLDCAYMAFYVFIHVFTLF